MIGIRGRKRELIPARGTAPTSLTSGNLTPTSLTSGNPLAGDPLSGATDPLGYVIPPSGLSPSQIQRDLVAVMDQRRYSAGFGVPSVPTRYLVRMNPADRAWLPADLAIELARTLSIYAERTGALQVGQISVAFRSDRAVAPGRPSVWAGFAEDDLLVLADPSAALDVFVNI